MKIIKLNTSAIESEAIKYPFQGHLSAERGVGIQRSLQEVVCGQPSLSDL